MAFKRDWACKKCNIVEKDVPTDIKEMTCSECGGKMEKIWEPPMVIFNGKGWTERFYN